MFIYVFSCTGPNRNKCNKVCWGKVPSTKAENRGSRKFSKLPSPWARNQPFPDEIVTSSEKLGEIFRRYFQYHNPSRSSKRPVPADAILDWVVFVFQLLTISRSFWSFGSRWEENGVRLDGPRILLPIPCLHLSSVLSLGSPRASPILCDEWSGSCLTSYRQ